MNKWEGPFMDQWWESAMDEEDDKGPDENGKII